jgi:ATP-dependent Lon protease
VSKKVVIPVEHKRAFLEVPGDVAEKVDPVFYGEVKQAALKAVAAS